jgi:putative flippase GtrA
MTGVVRSGPRYLAGAVLCAEINNVILIGGARLGVPDTVGVILTWLVGSSVGYAWHALVTYGDRLHWRAYGQFMAGGALGTPLSWLLVMTMRKGLGWPMEWTAPAMTVLMLIYNYLNARAAIHWRRRKAAG